MNQFTTSKFKKALNKPGVPSFCRRVYEAKKETDH